MIPAIACPNIHRANPSPVRGNRCRYQSYLNFFVGRIGQQPTQRQREAGDVQVALVYFDVT